MASILEFKTSPASARPGAAGRDVNGTAEIILFPGVRYERATQEAVPHSKPRARTRRDRLELDG